MNKSQKKKVIMQGLHNFEDLSNRGNLIIHMRGHACKNILLEKKFLLKAGITCTRKNRGGERPGYTG